MRAKRPYFKTPRAQFCPVAWQNHIGVRVKDETGAIMGTELLTNDAEAATKFYSDLLGMSSSKMPGPVDYTMLKVGEADVAGVMAITDEVGPSGLGVLNI